MVYKYEYSKQQKKRFATENPQNVTHKMIRTNIRDDSIDSIMERAQTAKQKSAKKKNIASKHSAIQKLQSLRPLVYYSYHKNQSIVKSQVFISLFLFHFQFFACCHIRHTEILNVCTSRVYTRVCLFETREARQ